MMATNWRMNNCFESLNKKLRKKYPGIVIYGVGDLTHQKRKSDHNPNQFGRVNAEDYMRSVAFTHADATDLCYWLIRDPRTKYVIYNRRIWEFDTQRWLTYHGDNPHTDHVHHSVHDSADTITGEWRLEEGKSVAVQDDVWGYDIDPTTNSYSAKGWLWTTGQRVEETRQDVNGLVTEIAELKSALATQGAAINALADIVQSFINEPGVDPNPLVDVVRYAIANPNPS